MTSLAADGDEFLENGASTRTPTGDNLVLDYARAEAAGHSAIAAARGGRILDDPELGLHLCDLGLPTPFGNIASIVQAVREADGGAVLDRMARFYGEGPGGPFLVFSPWTTPDWRPAGLAPVGHPPLMLRPAGDATQTVAGLEIVPVRDADTLADFERTLVEAYPVPELEPWERERYLHPQVLDTTWRFFVGYESGRPVATAAAFLTPSLTVIELVSTRSECRGRGYGAAVTAAASSVAPSLPSMLIASDPGQRVYESLGYLRLLRYTLWIGSRSG